MSPPSLLYLHGFASGPDSKKGVAFARHFAGRGVDVQRLDLRRPSLQHLRLSAILAEIDRAIGHASAILIGSSLGGLAAARAAERNKNVVALVLLAPAFQLVERWQAQLGPAWHAWQTTGWHEVLDYTTGATTRIDFGFVQDVQTIDHGLADVTVPTLILHGIHDEVVPLASSQKLAATRPCVRVVELDDGHELVASLPRLLGETERFLRPYLPG